MGISRAFSEAGAQFGGMSPKPEGLFIGVVLQKTFVAVDEKGTEAAAATVVTARKRKKSSADAGFEMRCDRPFLFVIQDTQTGLVLFVGLVESPPQVPEQEEHHDEASEGGEVVKAGKKRGRGRRK